MSKPFHEVAGDMFYGIFYGDPLLRGVDPVKWEQTARELTGLSDPSPEDISTSKKLCLDHMKKLKSEGISGDLALWFLAHDEVYKVVSADIKLSV